MDWNLFKIDRFAKLMAMALSTQENEAASALRMAGRMLREAGGSFDDIADVVRRPSQPLLPSVTPAPEPPSLEERPGDWGASIMMQRLARAEARVNALTQENEPYKKQLDDAIRYIVELEDQVGRSRGRH
ncbi:MAG: DUF2786 domain-containing protein [Alphaproteobacteria bacterium]|nr:DUF2786 domain-containing protein [Alphaproteobacteria bacterium]